MTEQEQWEDDIEKIQEAMWEDSLRILKVLERRPLRFSQIKRLLNLKPARLEHLLKMLCKWFWIVPRTVPNKAFVKFLELHKGVAIPDRPVPPKNCKILVEYRLSKRL